MGKVSVRLAGLVGGIAAVCVSLTPLAAHSDAALPIGDVAQSSDQANSTAGSQPVQLAAFDYEEFFDRVTQLGMLSQNLGYTMTVAPDGKVTDCALSRSFRSSYTTKEMCKALSRYAQFEPARDAQGNAVSGTYKGEVRIYSYFAANR
jgi:hypothetical protein